MASEDNGVTVASTRCKRSQGRIVRNVLALRKYTVGDVRRSCANGVPDAFEAS